jgi:hypothetical protein
MTSNREEDRKRFAASALGGLLADPNRKVADPTQVADVAVRYADAVILRLEGQTAPVDPNVRDRPGDSRTAGQRDRQQQVIQDGLAARRAEEAKTAAKASPKLRDLEVSGRACAPLERIKVETLHQLAVHRRETIEAVKGVAAETMKQFDSLLEEHGLTWEFDPTAATEEPDETSSDAPADEDDGDEEDIL